MCIHSNTSNDETDADIWIRSKMLLDNKQNHFPIAGLILYNFIIQDYDMYVYVPILWNLHHWEPIFPNWYKLIHVLPKNVLELVIYVEKNLLLFNFVNTILTFQIIAIILKNMKNCNHYEVLRSYFRNSVTCKENL